MSLSVALQMDAPQGINPAGDSTLALALEAQSRGYELYYYQAGELSMDNASITAPLRPISFRDTPTDFVDIGEAVERDITEMDVVLMRQDPPFDMGYITATYMLESVQGLVRVINDPASVRNAPEKLSIFNFPDFIPATLVSREEERIMAFAREHGSIILKPLHGYGGHAVYKLDAEDGNLPALIEQFRQIYKEPFMAQQFLPEVKDQDRRVIIIDGQVEAVLGRIPAPGQVRANFRVGGSPAKAELTALQKDICLTVGPMLKEAGILFAGLDLIGDYLTEINVTSPTGLRVAHKLYGIKPEEKFWDAVERD